MLELDTAGWSGREALEKYFAMKKKVLLMVKVKFFKTAVGFES